MAGKFLDLEAAAEKLGVSTEELVEMRSKGQIHGYRDGSSWKFKIDEVDRVASEMSGGSLDDEFDLLGDDESDIIGNALIDDDDDDDGIIGGSELDSEDDESLVGESSDILGGSDVSEGASSISGDFDSGALGGEDGSDLSLEPTSDLGLSDSGLSGLSDLSLGDDEDLQDPEEGGTGDLEPDSDIMSGGSDVDLEGDEAGQSDLDFTGSSDLALGADDDEELVLESDIGSDVTLGTGDTGINLGSPSESGLDLEEPVLELEGSSLELGEDDDMISLDTDAADPDEATQLKQDEEFLLQPMDDQVQDESDSGSQVIALEDSEIMDEAMMGDQVMDQVQMVEEPMGGAFADAGMMEAAPQADMGMGAPGMQAQMAAAPMVPQSYEPPEAPYSIWNVLALLCSLMLLIVSGMLMVDVIRNIWSWEGNYEATSSIMDSLIQAFGLD